MRLTAIYHKDFIPEEIAERYPTPAMYIGTITTGHTGGDYVEINAGVTVKEIPAATPYGTYVNAPVSESYTYDDGPPATWTGETSGDVIEVAP